MCDHELTSAEVANLAPGAAPATPDQPTSGAGECRYCGAAEGPPSHVYGERKCCPDCDHRPAAPAVSGVEGLTEVTLTRFIDSLPTALFTVNDQKRLRGWLVEYLQEQS